MLDRCSRVDGQRIKVGNRVLKVTECRHRQCQIGRIVFLYRSVRSLLLSHRDQRHSQSVCAILVLKATRLIVTNQFELLEPFVLPSTINADLKSNLMLIVFDRHRLPRKQRAVVTHHAQQGFQRLVVDVTHTTELGIVSISCNVQLRRKEKLVRMLQRDRVHSNRAASIATLERPPRLLLRKLRQRVNFLHDRRLSY